ncbi:MAG: Hpt domain-containing protein, partial [Thiovulaceae bacterium]|nr:Hpt domain-containing protein [Sulfurimonadaceae bacterium]
MVIYDDKKQFIGIDEDNLKSLRYSNLASLQAEAADFADLFVKIPGHIHNFKHVHWIDFILCSTDKNSSKVIIHANGKNFSSILDIKTIYLTSNPTKTSYIISLNNLRTLSDEETQEISGELQTRVAPISTSHINEVYKDDENLIEEDSPTNISETALTQSIQHDEMDIQTHIPLETKVEEDPYEIEDEFNLDVFEPTQEELDLIGEAEPDSGQITREELSDNLHEHITIDDDLLETEEEVTQHIPDEPKEISKDKIDEEYIFNIQETADALEMDIATIEDFVKDFIMQAKEFKPKLYDAVEEDDMIELKSLSHQLKGVAANLRIHDAEEILVKINKAEDFTTSLIDLDKFYMIMAKLAGEDKKINNTEDIEEFNEPLEIPEVEDDIFEIDEEALKVDEPLEIPEVEDDAFVIDEEALKVDEPFEILEVDEKALEIADIDNFDMLDEEQNELIETRQKEDILSDIEDEKPLQ